MESTYSPITESESLFLTLFCDTFVQNSIPYKKFLKGFLVKMHRFRLIHQKLNHNHFCGPLLAGGLFKIPFHTKNFLRKFFIKMHRFRLIHQKLSQKGFFVPLLVALLCKIQFSIKNFLRKFFVKVHGIDLFDNN